MDVWKKKIFFLKILNHRWRALTCFHRLFGGFFIFFVEYIYKTPRKNLQNLWHFDRAFWHGFWTFQAICLLSMSGRLAPGQPGTELAPGSNQSGTELAPGSNQSGTELAPGSNQSGTDVRLVIGCHWFHCLWLVHLSVPDWLEPGASSVPDWLEPGASSVPDWLEPGASSVRSQLTTDCLR